MNVKSCETCIEFKGDKCTEGEAGKDYCLGGDFELYSVDIDKIKSKREKEKKEISDSQNKEVGLDLDTKSDAEVEKLAEETIEEIEKLSEDKEDFEGYNNIEKPKEKLEEPKSYSCDSCKNNSKMVGCFLNKYTDCTANSRYLFEPVINENNEPMATGLEGKEDEKEKDDAVNMIDDILGED